MRGRGFGGVAASETIGWCVLVGVWGWVQVAQSRLISLQDRGIRFS